ncbi:MAG TPA: hypothetical protein VHS97_14230 [Isosphaeraceae bacterium]|nr:hypothetical protein [Isosphaeraceae bacterium]
MPLLYKLRHQGACHGSGVIAPDVRRPNRRFHGKLTAPNYAVQFLAASARKPGGENGLTLREFVVLAKLVNAGDSPPPEELRGYDPDRGDLVGWRRVNDILEEIPNMAGFQSPRLKIRFEPGDGPDNLKIIGPDGEPFLTYAELVKQRNADRQRAEEKARLAEGQTQRADRLAARLRELGIEPD